MKRNTFLINKAFRKYLLASILTVAAAQVASIVDASLVGNIIGPEGLAAVIISKPVLQGIYAISTLFVASVTMMTGMALGKGDREKANSFFTFSLITSFVIGTVISLGGVIWLDDISALLCMSDELRPMANAFMLVTFLSALPMLFMLTLEQFVTIDGSPKLISRAVIIGNIVNVGLNIVFMRYLHMGIAGAAWATFTMYVVCTLIALLHFRKSSTLRLCISRIREYLDLKQMLTLGMPLFLSTVLISVQFTCINNITLKYLGSNALVIVAVCMQLYAFSMIILTGTLRTIQPVGSILRGINDSVGMMMLLKKAYTFMAMGLVVIMAVLCIFPSEICLFLGADSPGSLLIGQSALPVFSLFIVMQALLYNFMPVYQFYGHHRLALLLSVGQTLLPILCFWITAQTDYPWWGFFFGQALTAILLFSCVAITRRKYPDTYPLTLIPRTQYPTLELSFANSMEDEHNALQQIGPWLKEQGINEHVIFSAKIVADELMSNVVRHSEQNNLHTYTDLRLVIEPEHVVLFLTDCGKPFNPIEHKDKGYGLHIVEGVVKEMKYNYQFGQNMIKCLIHNA